MMSQAAAATIWSPKSARSANRFRTCAHANPSGSAKAPPSARTVCMLSAVKRAKPTRPTHRRSGWRSSDGQRRDRAVQLRSTPSRNGDASKKAAVQIMRGMIKPSGVEPRCSVAATRRHVARLASTIPHSTPTPCCWRICEVRMSEREKPEGLAGCMLTSCCSSPPPMSWHVISPTAIVGQVAIADLVCVLRFQTKTLLLPEATLATPLVREQGYTRTPHLARRRSIRRAIVRRGVLAVRTGCCRCRKA